MVNIADSDMTGMSVGSQSDNEAKYSMTWYLECPQDFLTLDGVVYLSKVDQKWYVSRWENMDFSWGLN